MVDYLSSTDAVRKLARSVVEQDFEDDEIQPHQKAAYSWLRTKTGKKVWDADNDIEYHAGVEAETHAAAVFVLNHEAGLSLELPGVQHLWMIAKELLDTIVGSTVSDVAGEESDQIESTPILDWGRNPDVRPPNKLKKFRRGG